MLRGDDHVFRARVGEELRPGLRIVFGGGEVPGERPVSRLGNFGVVHIPFAARRNGINAPVDENSEARVVKPFHPRGAGGRRFIAREHRIRRQTRAAFAEKNRTGIAECGCVCGLRKIREQTAAQNEREAEDEFGFHGLADY